jgi:hypothetical protein
VGDQPVVRPLPTQDNISTTLTFRYSRASGGIQNSENRRRKRFSVHKMLNRRKAEGEHWTLYKELMDDA